MIPYLLYKLKNHRAVHFESRKISPLLRSRGNICDKNYQEFFFDFSDPTTHLGDRLFFIPLIDSLIAAGFSVCINANDMITDVLAESILGLSLKKTDAPSSKALTVYPAPSYLNFKRLYPKSCLVDFTDLAVLTKICEQLILSFNKYFQLTLQNKIFSWTINSSSTSNFLINDRSTEYYLFSNYIDSGRFRKFFIDESKLFKQAVKLKRQGYKIIHVGSKQDKLKDTNHYPFVDVDLRGETSIGDLIHMVKAENVIGAITYDNFLMHLFGIYGKVAYILFRGRFTLKSRQHHMLYVNNTFFKVEGRLIYL